MRILEYSSRFGEALEKRLESEAFPRRKLEEVRAIVNGVRTRGDRAVREYTHRFDGVKIGKLAVPPQEFARVRRLLEPDLLRAFRRVRRNIREYQSAGMARSWRKKRKDGSVIGEKVGPIPSAGLYIPGGKAPLVSTVFMTALPAQLAGVERIVLVTPPGPDGRANPWILAAADFLGCREVYRVGGAQAVAALAFGTGSIPRVAKIAGPGNIYVTLAKKEVYGYVDIDMLAGPSEIAIIADGSAPPRKLAADLLAQAEHGTGGFSFLISTSKRLLAEVARTIPELTEHLSRGDILTRAMEREVALVWVPGPAAAAELVNRLAPEHLEIVTRQPEKMMARIRNAGAIFLGEFSPVAAGDYIAGPSHVLPTGGGARYFSPLSVNDFLKKSSFVRYSREALREEAGMIEKLARLEGLDAHALSIASSFREAKK